MRPYPPQRPSRRESRPRRGLLSRSALAGLVAAGALVGCDNPSCVFGSSGCQSGAGTEGQLGVGAAAVPSDGVWIVDSFPTVQAVFPSGTGVHPESPIVVRFSESMNANSVQGAFRLIDASQVGSLPLATSSALLGAGRLLVLFPAVNLPANSNIQVVFQDSNAARDLTGQPLQEALESVVGSFTVAEVAPTTPKLLTAWPPDDELNASATTDIVAVFDRKMKTTNFVGEGWQVEVDGSAPTPDPFPTAVNVSPLGSLPIPDTRAWTYRRTNAGTGLPVPYPQDAVVTLALSTAPFALQSTEDEALPPTTVTFDVAPFGAPLAAAITSAPADAIGIANLTAGDPRALSIDLTLAGTQAGDRVSVFAFGTGLGDEPVLVATQSDVDLTAVTEPLTVTLGQTPLLQSASPLQASFADGSVNLAFRVSRGSVVSPLRMLDVDPVLPGVQAPILDTVRPTFTDLDLPGGGGDLFYSSLRDLVLTGRASERLRAVNVVAYPGAPEEQSNMDVTGDEFSPVVGSTDSGRFIAAPVALGLVGPVVQGKPPATTFGVPDVPYTFRLYDRALNANVTEFAGLFRQRGAVSGATVGENATIHIEVVDANTLEPVESALVVAGGYVSPTDPPVDLESSLTDVDGRTTITSKAAANPTVVTIDATGYDMVTFFDVQTNWMSVLVEPSSLALASVAGAVTAVSEGAQGFLANANVRLADTRRPDGTDPTYGTQACTADPFTGLNPNCGFGPEAVRPNHIGAQTLFVGNFGLVEPAFSAAEFLKGFELRLPLQPAPPGGLVSSTAQLEKLLSTTEPGVQLSELPTSVGTQTLDTEEIAGFENGLDFENLVDDGVFAGDAQVFVEARMPGVDRPVVVGAGLSYPIAASDPTWRIEGVFPGELVDYLAQFGDLLDLTYLAVTLEDEDGNRAVTRPLLSATPNPTGIFDALVPPLVPRIKVPAIGAPVPVGPLHFNFVDSFVPAYQAVYLADGLHRVRLEDSGGRGHDIYRYDADPGTTGLDVFALDTTDPSLVSEGDGLALGPVQMRTGFFAWQLFGSAGAPDGAFARNNFLWSDIPLQATLMAESGTREGAVDVAFELVEPGP